MLRIEVRRPSDWHLLPAVDSAEYAAWCDQSIMDAPASVADGLASDLARVPYLAKELDLTDAVWMAVLSTDPTWAGVRALGHLRVTPSKGLDSLEHELRNVLCSAPQRLERRSIDRPTIAGRRMVRSVEIVAEPRPDGSSLLHQRFTGALRDEDTDHCIRLEMSSPDLLRLGRLGEICTEVLGSARVTEHAGRT